jgi:hypothetical protein
MSDGSVMLTAEEYYEHRAKMAKLEHENEEHADQLASADHELLHIKRTLRELIGAPAHEEAHGAAAAHDEPAALAQVHEDAAGASAAAPSAAPADEATCATLPRARASRSTDALPATPGQATTPATVGHTTTTASNDMFAESHDITVLDVPFEEKDTVKAVGAKWDPDNSKWFVPPHTDLKPFQRWLPAARIYLNCPYGEKDDAKAKGAKWDPDTLRWFICGGTDTTPFRKWM